MPSKTLDDIHGVLVDINAVLVAILTMENEKRNAMIEGMQLTNPSRQALEQSDRPEG